ncbi:MAG: molybdopterin cofactor-binding domain-containing protein [Gemmatimonadota bacterium]
MADYRLIGTSQAPKDLVAKITGRARYAEDYRVDGMVFAKLLLSPVPNGRVTRLDVSRALEVPGVLGVLTPDDLEPQEGTGEPLLASEPKYQGQPLAAVAAVDETAAAEGVAAIVLEIERKPFVLDPIESLRPGGPNSWEIPNEEDPEGPLLSVNSFEGFGMAEIKWSEADIAALEGDTFPEGEFPGATGFEKGDLADAFARSAVIVEQPIVYASHSHHPMEPRSSMAYWQGGKCFVHCSTQSTARTARSYAGRLGLEEADLVLISPFVGGGFGSKIGGSVTDLIPAHLSRKINRPVMLRVSRDEETYFGRARPGLQGWVKMGFRADGRVLAVDLLVIQENGPYGRQGDMGQAGNVTSLILQPEAMRHRAIAVLTNTPPKSAQRGPGGAQVVPMITTVLEMGAKQLGVDRVDMMLLNAPENRAAFGGGNARVSTAFVREAIQMGREQFNWDQKRNLSGQVNGSKVTGVGLSLSSYVAGSSGMDGLVVIRPDGSVTIHSGIGNLGTHSVFDTGMAAAEVLGVNWDEVQYVWGDSSQGLPWSSSQSGSQTTHAHTRANWAAGHDALRKLQEIAARDLGGNPGDYTVDGRRVFRASSPSVGMTFAQAAQRAIALGGRYDGHELPEDINSMTVATVQTHLVGQGLIGVARDTYGGQGSVWSSTVSFAVVEVDRETGVIEVKEMLTVGDVGTILNPRSLNAQINGGVLQGMSAARFEHWAFDPRWGVNQNKGFHSVKPFSILDVPEQMTAMAVNIADDQTPVGSRGVGEPPVGGGAGAIVSAVYDAIGVPIYRTPLTPDKILNAIEGGATGYTTLQTHV